MADLCDIPTLLAMRASCTTLNSHASAILNSEKIALMEHYHEQQEVIWRHLDSARAVVGGLAALSFVLREPRVLPEAMDVYVTPLQGEHLEQWLEEDEELHMNLSTTVVWTTANPEAGRRHITRTTTFPTGNGRFIHIHTATSHSALEPIVSTGVTALMNWVSARAFGCAYPALTLNRRALACRRDDSNRGLHAVYDALENNGFEIEQTASAWSEWELQVPPATYHLHRPCMRTLYLCAWQGRYFGDGGSLVSVFDFLCDHERLRSQHQPPYGIGVAWRMWCEEVPCSGRCLSRDPV